MADRVVLLDLKTDIDSRPGSGELIGIARIEYNGMVIESIRLVSYGEGKVSVYYPTKTDQSGQRYECVRPASREVKQLMRDSLLAQAQRWISEREPARAVEIWGFGAGNWGKV